MPHIQLQYTKEVKLCHIEDIFKKIENILIDNTSIKENNCKYKALLLPLISMGPKSISNFLHLEISILEGRSSEIKKLICEESLKVLTESSFSNSSLKFQYSVEIIDIIKSNYYSTNQI